MLREIGIFHSLAPALLLSYAPHAFDLNLGPFFFQVTVSIAALTAEERAAQDAVRDAREARRQRLKGVFAFMCVREKREREERGWCVGKGAWEINKFQYWIHGGVCASLLCMREQALNSHTTHSRASGQLQHPERRRKGGSGRCCWRKRATRGHV